MSWNGCSVDVSPRSSAQGSDLHQGNGSEHGSESGLGPSPTRTLDRRPSFGLHRDTTPKRTASVSIQNVRDLLGEDASEFEKMGGEDGEHYDLDEEDEEEDDNEELLDLAATTNVMLDKIMSRLNEVSDTGDTVRDIVNQHSEYLHSIEYLQSQVIREKMKDSDKLSRWVRSRWERILQFDDAFHICSTIQIVLSAIGNIPFVGPLLQCICLLNLACFAYISCPQAVQNWSQYTGRLALSAVEVLFAPLIRCVEQAFAHVYTHVASGYSTLIVDSIIEHVGHDLRGNFSVEAASGVVAEL